MGSATLTGVFPLRILPDYQPIEVPDFHVCEGWGDSRKDYGGTKVDVLLQVLPEWKKQAPQGDVVWYVGCTNRSEEYRIVRFDIFQESLRCVMPSLLVQRS